MALTCKDVIGLLSEYLDAALGPRAAEDLEDHLADCDECLAYLRTFGATRDLTARAGRVEMPREMQARIHRFLLDRLRRVGP